MKCIEETLLGIDTGCFFDSHHVTECMRRSFSNEYLAIAKQIDSKENLTLMTHRQIGHQIAKFEGKLVERQPAQSWPLNIHGNASSCTLWKRI